MAGTLYLVATPIGNLGDFSPRGVETLERADFIAAEDTRVSMKLLTHFGIKKPLVSYHEHNRASAGQTILTRLLAGETCALVTDAGTPAISDPGEDLVRLCGENNIVVEAIPGCCAAICALAVSGLPTGRFTFEGFLPANKKERRTALLRLQGEERTMVFHEAPHKLRATLSDMAEILGDRPVALCRELKKRTDEDLQNNVIARFHDESQLNRLVAETPGKFRILPPDYCTPEETPTGHEAILVLQKSRCINVESVKGAAKPQNFVQRKWEAFRLNWLPYLWLARDTLLRRRIDFKNDL